MTAKADPWAQLKLLDLQALDTRLDQLAHRVASLPEHAEIAAADEALAGVSDRVVVAATEADDLSRAVRKAEADVEQVRTRVSRDQALLDSGSVTSAKQLEDLQRELASLARRQNDLEDAELEIMEALETAQAAVLALEGERSGIESARAAAVQRRDARAPGTKLESSGGLSLDSAAAYAATGVDYLAVGALTHSVRVLDVGLDT